MTIEEIENEIIEEFEMFEDWMQRYEHLIDLGKSMPLIEDKYKTVIDLDGKAIEIGLLLIKKFSIQQDKMIIKQ